MAGGGLRRADSVEEMYVRRDTLSTRISIHDKYSVNPQGWHNWVFDQYRLGKGQSILEAGCGTARTWLSGLERIPPGCRITLTDFSPRMAETAAKLLGDHPAFDCRQMDIREIPYPNASFDIVIANHMLYHVPELPEALREVGRVLKPGGLFYAATAGAGNMPELDDLYRALGDKYEFHYAADLSFLLENGGEILRPHFASIERLIYPDALEVADLDDLIAYIKSYNHVPAELEDELCGLVQSRFSDGIFHISKAQGMFVCRK